MGVPHHVIQKNVLIGHKNMLRVLLSLVYSADDELIERISDQLYNMDDAALDRVAENHGRSLRMTPATARRHLEKIIDGQHLDIIWPDLPDLSEPARDSVRESNTDTDKGES